MGARQKFNLPTIRQVLSLNMDPVNNRTLDDADSESPTRKVAAAVLGAIVVVVMVLILVLGIQAVRSLVARNQKTPTVNTKNLTLLNNSEPPSVPQSTISGQTNTYQTMPATGPKEDALVAMALIALLGCGIVVVSQKFS